MSLGRRVQAMGDRLFVEVLGNEKRYGSIVIPDNYKDRLDLLISRVHTRGPQVKARIWELAPGDYVCHVRTCLLRYDAEFSKVGTKESSTFGFIFEKDIICVIDPELIEKIGGTAQYSEGRTGEWHQ